MEQILVDLKKSLQEIAGDRLIKMVLYGSRARGDFSEIPIRILPLLSAVSPRK